MSIVGTRIKQVREQRGLTQKDLANRIHKSPATVSAYEVGMQTPPTDVLLSIARVLPESYMSLSHTLPGRQATMVSLHFT